MVENAAMSAAMLRDPHIRWIYGEAIPITEMASLENTFNRPAAALGISRRSKDVLSIDSYLKKGDAAE